MAGTDVLAAASGEKAPFLYNAPGESCATDVPSKASKEAPLVLFHPLVPRSERQVHDFPFLLLAVALALSWLVLVVRQAFFLSPQILPSLSLLPPLALALSLGVGAFVLFLWLASRVKHELVSVCTWIAVGFCVLQIVTIAILLAFLQSIYISAQQQQQPPQEQLLTVPLLVSGSQIVLSLCMLIDLAWIGAYVWANTRKDLFPPTTTLLADAAAFFLSKGRKILLLLLACFALSALLLLPLLVHIVKTVESCLTEGQPEDPSRGRGTREVGLGPHLPPLSLLLHPRSLAAAAGMGHATSASLATYPLPDARALYQVSGQSGVSQSDPFASFFSSGNSSSTDGPHPSQECLELLHSLVPTSPASIVFGILGLLILPWVSRMVSSAFVFLSSFCLAEEASASASASACRTPLLRILSLCFWHSLGTLTFGCFLMDLLGFAVGVLTVILISLGAPLVAVSFLSLAVLLLVLFQLLYYKLVIPLVAIHGCSLFEACSKAFDLLRTFPHEVLFLQVVSYGLCFILTLVCVLALEVVKVGPVMLLGSLYEPDLHVIAVLLAGLGASHLLDCVIALWAASLGAALINSLYLPGRVPLLQGQEASGEKLCCKAEEGGKLVSSQA